MSELRESKKTGYIAVGKRRSSTIDCGSEQRNSIKNNPREEQGFAGEPRQE